MHEDPKITRYRMIVSDKLLRRHYLSLTIATNV